MRPECPVCGRLFWCDYPNQWVYKRGNQFICSWSCIREYDRKEAEKMAYSKIRKDGTPAKVPGKKKEEPKVELVHDPEIAEEYRREQAQKEANARAKAEAEKDIKQKKQIMGMEPLEICGVRSRVLKDGIYTKNTAGNAMYLTGLSMTEDHLGLRSENWIRLSAEILLALKQLGMEV